MDIKNILGLEPIEKPEKESEFYSLLKQIIEKKTVKAEQMQQFTTMFSDLQKKGYIGTNLIILLNIYLNRQATPKQVQFLDHEHLKSLKKLKNVKIKNMHQLGDEIKSQV